MQTAKRIALIFLLALMSLPLAACGETVTTPYRIIETLGDIEYGSACRLGDKAAAPINAAMSVLAANGTLSSLSSGWLGSDRICLTGDADALDKLEELPEPRTLIVGVEGDFSPMSYSDGESYIGMSVDIAKAVGSLLGWEVRIQPIRAAEVGMQLNSGNIDWAVGFGLQGLDAGSYTLGGCYMKSSMVVAVAADSDIKRIRDLKGMKLGSVKDSSMISALNANEDIVKYVDSVTAYLSPIRCINALSNGWCGAVAMDSIMLNAYFK